MNCVLHWYSKQTSFHKVSSCRGMDVASWKANKIIKVCSRTFKLALISWKSYELAFGLMCYQIEKKANMYLTTYRKTHQKLSWKPHQRCFEDIFSRKIELNFRSTFFFKFPSDFYVNIRANPSRKAAYPSTHQLNNFLSSISRWKNSSRKRVGNFISAFINPEFTFDVPYTTVLVTNHGNRGEV